MDTDGYPDDNELEKIKNWKAIDFMSLIDFIKTIWNYNSVILKWQKDDLYNKDELKLTMHTYGWSGNESIIYALLDNFVFRSMFYYQWNRGGHYIFLIDPYRCGYKLVSDYCKEQGITRQYIWNIKDRFDWIIITKNKRLIRPK